jgi:hypothetical protein
LVGSLPPQAVHDLIALGDHILDRLTHVRAGEAEHGKKLFVALEIWWSPRLVKDELWSEDLIEDVGIPGPKNILHEFVEALDDGLVLFRRLFFSVLLLRATHLVLHPFLMMPPSIVQCELRRISLPRTRVNNGEKTKGRGR